MMTNEQLAEIKARAESARQKPIPGYSGYEADIYGNVWSVSTNWRGYGARILTTEPDPDGYLKVRIYRNGKRIRKAVHHLIALAFSGIPPESYEVRHLNGQRDDNRLNNLCWGTRKENAEDRDRHGKTAIGSRNGQAKLLEAEVVAINKLLIEGKPQREIAKLFGVSQRTIGRIHRKEGWLNVS